MVEKLLSCQVDDLVFQFVIEKQFLKRVIVQITLTNEELDIFTKSDVATKTIHLNHPRWSKIEPVMRSLESYWALWGVESIAVESPHVEFIAESESEKKLITVTNFQVSYTQVDMSKVKPLPPDLVLRPVFASVQEGANDLRLSFYRRGMIDLRHREFIEAFYDFYLMLESAFSEGKTKNQHVKAKFKDSKVLNMALNETLFSPDYSRSLPQELQKQFEQDFASLSVEEYIHHIVMLRGFLHHHNIKRDQNWSPVDQVKYRLDALILQDICNRIAFWIFWDALEKNDTRAIYEELIESYLNATGRH
ncbi:hypothetical protein KUL156_07140 [Alteromonas sp. KUL156]|nr:hypothetical protein KUL154_47020 [Alteromonas sp. KUL154]GFD98121.1 hypothetical protein KUL156_07140 [Alteromonas sp. KUL156]